MTSANNLNMCTQQDDADSSFQIVEGAATVGWAMCAAFILPDFPANTKRLTSRERELAISRLEADNVHGRTEDTPHLTSLQALRQSVTNWRTWILVAGYMVIVGSSTLSYFYPTLVAGLGYSAHMAQYMVVPIYAVAFVAVLITGYFSDKYPRQRGAIIACWLSVSMVCAIVICVVYNFKARYVLLVFMAAGLWATNGCSLSYAASTFGSMQQETRAVSLALVNALGNLAQIYGAYLFPSDDSPKYLLVRNSENRPGNLNLLTICRASVSYQECARSALRSTHWLMSF